MGVIAAGCGGHHHAAAAPVSNAITTTTSTTTPQPRFVPANLDTSASLIFALPSAPTNWNPLAAAGAGEATALVASGVLPSVFRMQADGTLGLDSDFVTSVSETRRAPQTIVYNLNPKATWSDGVAITAADFAYTWKTQSGKASFRDLGGRPFSPASTIGYDRIASVAETGGDPDTVTVVFSTPYAGWQSLFGPILPAHIAQRVGFDQGFTDPVDDDVSGGPFLVQSEVSGASLTLVRNARYWAAPASLSSITIDFVGATAAGRALTEGQLGAALVGIGDLPPGGGFVAQLRGATGIKVDEAPGDVWEDLEFGPRSPALADADLREAIVLAVDRSSLITATVGPGSGVVPLGNRFFLPQAPGYVDDTNGQDLHGNLTQAEEVLDRAGYTGAGGELEKGAAPVTLSLIYGVDDALHRAEAETLGGDLRALGIVVHATVVNNLDQRLAARDYDLALVDRQGGTTPEAVGLPGLATGSGSAIARRAATLVRQAAAAPSIQARNADYYKLDSLLWSDSTDLPLFQIPSVLAFQARYANLTNVSFGAGVGYNIAEWGVPIRS